jgi:predicted amidohydrolase YtcJ
VKKADLIMMNGIVYTADAHRTLTESVAVCGGRIVYVGSNEGVTPWLGPKTRIVDLKGRMAAPGFHDSHIHAIGAAYGRMQIQLTDVSSSREGILSRVRAYVRQHPEMVNYTGMGWDYTAFGSSGPSREDLDAICPQKPILLMSYDGHSAWVNSVALLLASISADTPDPPGGCIQRHPVSAQPTGWLQEPPAFRLVLRRLSFPSANQMKDLLIEFFQHLSAEGITSIMQPGVELFDQEEMFAVLAALEKEGRLPLRIVAGFRCGPQEGIRSVSTLKAMRRNYQGQLFKVGPAKLFLDGVVEAHTAWMLKPYTDRPDHRGRTIWNADSFREIMALLDRENIQVHIHTIGDGAVRLALDCIEAAIKANGDRGARHTLVHLDLTDRADIPRFARLGIVAAFQPAWFHIHEKEKEEYLRRLGKERVMDLYLMKSFLDSGAVVTCGSDYPVGNAEFSSFRPLDAIEIGHTRCAPGKARGESYRPSERVDLPDMIDCYTIRSAFQFFHEKEVGSIEVGKLADLIVLDRNLFETASHEIHKTKVLLTLLEGREVYRDSSF